jgi:alpha-methylacyl-CoA racemase
MNALDGYHVVSTAVNLPGPAALGRLAAMGARVTKIEPPAGDALRLLSPAWYEELTASMTVERLNLKDAGDRGRFDAFLEEADLFLTTNLPASLARLGLDHASLRDRFPRLCHVGITGYPPPRQDAPGHDITFAAELDLLTPPELPRTLVPDMAGAEQAVSTAVALLLLRERTGRAESRFVSLFEAGAFFAEPWRRGITAPGGFLGGGLPAYDLYETADGWVALAAIEPHFYNMLISEMGAKPACAEDFKAFFRVRTSAECAAMAREKNLPLAVVRAGESEREERER